MMQTSRPDWYSYFQLSNVIHLFEKIFNKINQTVDEHAPYKYLSRKHQKTASKSWITKLILK